MPPKLTSRAMRDRRDLNRLALVSVVCMGTVISVILIVLMLCARCGQMPHGPYQQCLRRDVDENEFELADQSTGLVAPASPDRRVSSTIPRSPTKEVDEAS